MGFSQRRYRALAASGVRCMYDGRTLPDVKRDPEGISRRQVFPVDRSGREFVSSVDVTAIIRDAMELHGIWLTLCDLSAANELANFVNQIP